MLTNDDGPPGRYSPFLLPFTRAFKQWLRKQQQQPARVFVCVPSDQQSWIGKAISRFTHVRAHTNWSTNTQADVDAASLATSPGEDITLWSTVDGTPSSTANVGLHVLAPFPIELVVSGPNLGRNTGRSFILSSGTVGAAMEGAMAGKKSIAVSFAFFEKLSTYTQQHIQDACTVAVMVIERLWKEWPDTGVEMFNVNIPLGCNTQVPIYKTHALIDFYGAIYSGSTSRQITQKDEQQQKPQDSQQASDTAKEILNSGLPLPSAATLPDPHPIPLPPTQQTASGSSSLLFPIPSNTNTTPDIATVINGSQNITVRPIAERQHSYIYNPAPLIFTPPLFA